MYIMSIIIKYGVTITFFFSVIQIYEVNGVVILIEYQLYTEGATV